MILTEGDYSRAQSNHKHPYKREAGGTERESVRMKAEVREEKRCSTSGFEDGGKGHESINGMASSSWKRQGNGFSPKVSRWSTGLPTSSF